ncbi:peroxidase [Sarracenia purpurea var. burkii]
MFLVIVAVLFLCLVGVWLVSFRPLDAGAAAFWMYLPMVFAVVHACLMAVGVKAGGPSWEVPRGRRDSQTANRSGILRSIPSPFEILADIRDNFTAIGLDSILLSSDMFPWGFS